MTVRLDEIKRLVEDYNDPAAVARAMRKRQRQLIKLVNKYGVPAVALAGGYAESTLKQYIRVSNPSNIGNDALKQATFILNQL